MAQELQRLAHQYATNPSEGNREAVVRAAVPLVRSLVGQLNLPDHPLASREDLENAGILGLLQALNAYDSARGTPFVSYAYGRIRGALVDYLRSIDVLPRERRRRLAEAQQAREVLRQMLGAEPEDQDVADYLDITLVDYHRLLTDAQSRYTIPLHAPMNADGTPAMLETLPNEDAMDAFDAIDRASMNAYLSTLIRELPEREQNILALYYFENLRLREIAKMLGLTEARISQILAKILYTLRTRLSRASVAVA